MTTRHPFLPFVAASLLAGAVSAQPPSVPPPPVNALRTPPSPAFTLLEIEPSAVERPSTPADFAVAFVNRTDTLDQLPKNFAAEASPYWLTSGSRLTWRQDDHRTPWQSTTRTLSVSIGTASRGDLTSLAVGVRTLVFSGQLTPETKRALEALEKVLAQDGDFFLSLLYAKGLGELDRQLVTGAITKEQYEARKLELAKVVLDSQEYKKSSPLKEAQDFAINRQGFSLEVAGGLLWDFADGSWESGDFRKRAIWVTPSYQSRQWNALGVFRYIGDTTADESAIDWGGRGMYSTQKYAASLEYVKRDFVGASRTLDGKFRLAGIFEYRVSDTFWMVASFGRDRQRTARRESLIAQLGLSLNFSKERYRFD